MTTHEKGNYIVSGVSLGCTVILGLYLAKMARANTIEDNTMTLINSKASSEYVDDRNDEQNEQIKANSAKIDFNYEKYDKKIDKIYEYIMDLKTEKK